jgi:hypothetical protein
MEPFPNEVSMTRHVLSVLKLCIIILSSGLENRGYSRRDPSRWPRGTFYPQKLSITSPTSCSRTVGIVRLRAHATEFSFFFSFFILSSICRTKSFLSIFEKIIRFQACCLLHVGTLFCLLFEEEHSSDMCPQTIHWLSADLMQYLDPKSAKYNYFLGKFVYFHMQRMRF